MFWELLAVIKCMIVFQKLNCDSVKKYWKYGVIYILMKKVIILRKIHLEMKSFAPS